MASQTPITDALMRELAKVDPATGKTNWETLVDTLRVKAASGDREAARMLEQATAIGAKNPEFRQSGRGNEP